MIVHQINFSAKMMKSTHLAWVVQASMNTVGMRAVGAILTPVLMQLGMNPEGLHTVKNGLQ